MKWCVDYVVGNTYKVKYVIADSASEAIKKAPPPGIYEQSLKKTIIGLSAVLLFADYRIKLRFFHWIKVIM